MIEYPLGFDTHAFRSRSADVVSGRHRAFQGQHLEDIAFNPLVKLLELVQRQIGQVTPLLFACTNGVCNGLVRIPKWDTLLDQIVGQVSGGRKAL